MDKETLANFLSNCGKHDFNIACSIVLKKAFSLNAINVDGPNDGGTDFISLSAEGERTQVAFQITTQKTDIKNKAYRDAEKSIRKLKVKRFYFLCTYNLSETECRTLENLISDDLDIPTQVYSPTLLADLMIGHKIVGEFLSRINHGDLHEFDSNNVDYREMALHSYSYLSKDARNLKSQIYDDSLLLVLSDYQTNGLSKEDAIKKALDLLALSDSKYDFLMKRIDSLMSRGVIKLSSLDPNYILATEEVVEDIKNRKSLYEREMIDLWAAQVDILKEYNVDWTQSDSRQAAVWIANTYMCKQIQTLEAADATLADNFNRTIDNHGYSKMRSFLHNNKGLEGEALDEAIDKLLQNASSQPLVVKITSATVYLALEGGNPLSSCKAIGIGRWQDMKMILEPTLGIPFICSLLYKGKVNRYFDNAILAVKRCMNLGINTFIPFYYIKECAGHLYLARKFDGLDLDPAEMQYSSNAFVSNYYALKSQGISMPDSFMDYLATFSPAIRTERSDYKEWIRDIMNNISSLLTRNSIEFLDLPTYSSEELKSVQMEYSRYLNERNLQKPSHLMMNDVLSLTHTNKLCTQKGESWMILTYDRSLINVASNGCSAWVNTPFVFLDLTEMSRDLNDMKLSSMVHSMASYSSKTLTIGARILDHIIQYASDKLQNWEFMESIKQFKTEMISSINQEDQNFMDDIEKKTDEFLAKHGITVDYENEHNDVDVDLDPESESK